MKKLLSIALTLGMLFIFAACDGGDAPTANSTSEDSAASEAPQVIPVLPETSTATDAIIETEESASLEETDETASGDASLPDVTTTTGTALATQPKLDAVAEIVAYYNAAANKVKADKPGYSFTEQTNINSINGGAKWLVNIVNSAITEETPQAAVVAKGADHKDFAVPGKDWASKLSAAAVQSASCVEKGGVYEIRIDMKREAQADLPKNAEEHEHGKAFKVYNAGMIYGVMAGYENLGAITKFAPTYHSSYILCTVDKATGSMKTARYSLTFDADIEAKLISALPVSASASISVTGKYVF